MSLIIPFAKARNYTHYTCNCSRWVEKWPKNAKFADQTPIAPRQISRRRHYIHMYIQSYNKLSYKQKTVFSMLQRQCKHADILVRMCVRVRTLQVTTSPYCNGFVKARLSFSIIKSFNAVTYRSFAALPFRRMITVYIRLWRWIKFIYSVRHWRKLFTSIFVKLILIFRRESCDGFEAYLNVNNSSEMRPTMQYKKTLNSIWSKRTFFKFI